MLKAKYLNKKYFFNKNGPIDEENQNLVIKSENFSVKTQLYGSIFILNFKILEKIGGWNKVLEEKPSTTMIKLAKKQIENKLKLVW